MTREKLKLLLSDGGGKVCKRYRLYDKALSAARMRKRFGWPAPAEYYARPLAADATAGGDGRSSVTD